MKIVILDGRMTNPGDLSWEGISALGDVTIYDRTPHVDSEIIRRIGDAEAVIISEVPIGQAVMEACPTLRFIAVLATGYNMIDVASAAERGIIVSNVPAYGTESVAQHAIALLLEICSRVYHHDEAVHNGCWSSCPDVCFWDYPLIELAGRTMGIVGYGRIGRRTAEIAKAIGMHVVANSSSHQNGADGVADFVDLDTLLRVSDVISLHCPLYPETRGIINRARIETMKKGVILINNSRGALIDEQALADALNSGKVAAAGLDVMSEEPIPSEHPLLTAKNCFITPHISWAPKEARRRILETTSENLKAYAAGAPIHTV